MSRRVLTLPLDHLDAELLAAPLADEVALRDALVALDPRLVDRATRRVWRATEGRLARGFPHTSLDELIARRDRLWFGPPGVDSPVSLTALLRRVGDHLARHGVDGEAPATRRRRMRWATFALPADLVTAFAEQPPLPRAAIIEGLLAEGVVEPHLHLGAALNFDTAWITTQYVLAQPSTHAEHFESAGAACDDGRRLAGWVLRGLIVRALVARYLAWHPNTAIEDDLGALLTARSSLPAYLRYRLAAIVRAVAGGPPDGLAFEALQTCYQHLVGLGPGQRQLPGRLDAVLEADGISPWFSALGGWSSEQRYIRAAVDAIEKTPEDILLARLFWQTVRLRVMLYRHVVQRPLTGGLQWFTRAFGRIRAVRGALSIPALVDSARQMSGAAEAIELRFTAPTQASALEAKLAAVDAASRVVEGGPDAAVILHLSRSRSDAHRAGAPAAYDLGAHAEPRSGQTFRYADYYRARRAETHAIVDLLRTRPATVELIRGVDICGDELAVPLWVLAPLLTAIRAAGRDAAARVGWPGRDVPPLRLLVHGGEDYVHLLGGLRRVDELVEYLDLGEGDRVAHALALGEDVERWCGSAYGRVQAREDRLLDLLWAWRCIKDSPTALLASWGGWLEAQIRRLAAALFPDVDLPIELLAAARDHLHDAGTLRRIGFPDQLKVLPSDDSPSLALAAQWISDRGVFRRGREVEEIDPRSIAPLIEALQRHVRARLSARSVIIEVNPSSNLLVGALTDLGQHPLWRLRPLTPDDAPSLMVCIGSDDPITFATSLPEEYQLVYDCLLEANVSSDCALSWLDDARRVGLRGRVALPTAQRVTPVNKQWPTAPVSTLPVLLP